MTARILDRPATTPATAGDDVVALILAEYEPLDRSARRAVAGVWQDRRVSKSALLVLFQLRCHGDQPMSRLAALVDVSLPNLTGIVSRMVELGLAERVRGDQDRRVVLVRATARGHEAMQEVEALRRDQMRRIVEAVEPRDRPLILDAFRVLREAAERVDAQTPPSSP